MSTDEMGAGGGVWVQRELGGVCAGELLMPLTVL